MNNVIRHIIDQHAEEAAFLWLMRGAAVHAPHYDLDDLVEHDERVEAHIDGLRVAGLYGWEVCEKNLEMQKAGEVFTAGVLAFESNDEDKLNIIYDVVEEDPESFKGVISALGWIDPQLLRGKVDGLLSSKKSLWRKVGIAAYAIHRMDPGEHLIKALMDEDVGVRSRAARAAGELGRADLYTMLLKQIRDNEPSVRFWSAWAAAMVGDRGFSLDLLRDEIMQNKLFSSRAMQVLFRVVDQQSSKQIFDDLAQSKETLRTAIIGAGITGDSSCLPWLIHQMEEPKFSRPAGEAFTFITGADIEDEELEGEWPEGFEAGPTENPEDEDVAMDEDEDLPWPDSGKVSAWWEKNKNRLNTNQRYLLGQPITSDHCKHVLKKGKQRQRQAAAMELALMRPEAILFETRARGKQQKQLS